MMAHLHYLQSYLTPRRRGGSLHPQEAGMASTSAGQTFCACTGHIPNLRSFAAFCKLLFLVAMPRIKAHSTKDAMQPMMKILATCLLEIGMEPSQAILCVICWHPMQSPPLYNPQATPAGKSSKHYDFGPKAASLTTNPGGVAAYKHCCQACAHRMEQHAERFQF